MDLIAADVLIEVNHVFVGLFSFVLKFGVFALSAWKVMVRRMQPQRSN